MTALQAGQMLEGTVYQIVRELGAGGMGVVYEVEHVRLKKRYVAKVIHDRVRGDENAQKRMEREAQVLADINHPNVVQVHDVGTTPDGTSYFVMEKLEGMDLRAAMRRGGVGRSRALAIVIDILDALAHVHQRGIVHRDIKPENVFLARQPTGTVTKVLDFGIVHIFDRDGSGSQGRLTTKGGFIGTLYYAAPEQMKGEAASPSNDVYATALVLFELIAGRGPFDDDHGVGVSRCFKPAPRLDTLLDVPLDLVAALAEALEQEPGRRPTAANLATRLRAVLAVEATTPGANERAALQAEVDDLLVNLSPQSGRALGLESRSFVGTEMPPTPVMAGAPSRVSATPPLAALGPIDIAPTMASAGPVAIVASAKSTQQLYVTPPPAPPHGDTSPGVYATVDSGRVLLPTPPMSVGTMSLVIGLFVLLFGGGAATVVSLVRHGRAPVTAAQAAPSAPSVPEAAAASVSASPSPEPASTLTPEPASTSTPTSAPARAVSAEPAASSAKPAPALAAPRPAPAKGRAKKDGYVEDL